MKKLILLSIFCVGLICNSGAQLISVTGDTVVNAASVTMTQQVKLQYTTLSIQVKLVKISGTVAGESVLLGSLDGTNYEAVAGTDTLTHTNVATQFHIWILDKADYLYYRVKSTGSGTMSAIASAAVLPKK